MSGLGNNYNSIPNVEPGPACIDLENSQIHMENELNPSDCNPIGLEDESAANISLIVKITKQIQKSMTEPNVPDSTVKRSTGANGVKDQDVKTIETTLSHESNQNDIAIMESSNKIISENAISTVSTKCKIKTNDISVTKEESFKDHSSSIPDSHVKEAFLADQSATRAEDTPGSLGSTKDIKVFVSSSGSINEFIENGEGMVLESGELSEDTSVNVKQDQCSPEHNPVKASEESESLEDGEVSDDDDPIIPVEVPVCRFYIRNGCSWGDNCRFRHPGTTKKGNYIMFENKVLPVVSSQFPPAWTPSMPPAYPCNLNNLKIERHYFQDAPEGPKRTPLLPTPSFNDILLAQKNYTKSDDIKRPVRNQPVVWATRPSSSSPSSTAFQWSPGRNRSPSVSPPRRNLQVSIQVRPTDTATLTSKPSIKRYRTPSPSQSSARRPRGPRTPPCSPPSIRPSASVQTAPKRQRHYTYLSSSTDSSDASSYTSNTDSSGVSSSSSSSDYDSDEEYRRMSSRHRNRKQPSKKRAKSPSRASNKCSSRQLDPPRRRETSVKKQTSRHTSKSKSRKHSKAKKKSSKRTPEKSLSTKQSRKLPGEGNSRREYLLMKLLQVEKLIAKKKKKIYMK